MVDFKDMLWIGAAILVVVLFIKYSNIPIQSTVDLDENKTEFSRGENPKYPQDDDDIDEEDIVAEEDEEEGTEEPIDDTDVITNECGSRNFGYPDYEGTNKEGQTCRDVIFSERTFECLANPPDNYDGEIDLMDLSSNPKMICCSVDGTCQW